VPAYQERFPVGARVRIAGRSKLELFRKQWTFHHPLEPEQVSFADRETTVKEVGFYHGGDPLYWLEGIPGVWHEECLSGI
jgi:hypothetical protein